MLLDGWRLFSMSQILPNIGFTDPRTFGILDNRHVIRTSEPGVGLVVMNRDSHYSDTVILGQIHCVKPWIINLYNIMLTRDTPSVHSYQTMNNRLIIQSNNMIIRRYNNKMKPLSRRTRSKKTNLLTGKSLKKRSQKIFGMKISSMKLQFKGHANYKSWKVPKSILYFVIHHDQSKHSWTLIKQRQFRVNE